MKNQFDETHKLKPLISDNPGNLKKQRFIEDEQNRFQKEAQNRPSNIAYFEDIMNNRDFKDKQTPRVGYLCNMIPAEIIAAMGAQPVRIDCGNAASAIIGEEALSGDICPLAKASFGSFLSEDSLTSSCDAFILPTSCDAKRKLGEAINDFKPAFMLNLPSEQNHYLYANQSYIEILRMVDFLKSRLNLRLSGKKLRQTVKLGQTRTLIIRQLQKLRIEKPRAISIMDFTLIIQSSLFRPVNLEEWIEQAKQSVSEIRKYQPERESLRPKIILTGAPVIWPNFKILNIMEESGADIIADTLCSGAQSCFDPAMSEEKTKGALLRALANKYIFASICPCFVSQSKRINRILELIDESKANAVANHSLRLCQLFDIENYRIEQTLKQKKIPYINIRTDYSMQDTEQLRVRIEAFLETL